MYLGAIIALFGLIISIISYTSQQDATSGPMFLGVAAILVGIMLELCLRDIEDNMLTILNPEPKE